MSDFPTLMDDETCRGLIMEPQIGRGGARVTFGVKDDPSVVIKKVHLPFVGANVIEWIIWAAVKDTPLGMLFGECRSISETGRYLIMERLEDISESDYSSTPTMPNWLNDLKPSNFGKSASGAIKLRDYATIQIGKQLAAALPYQWEWQRVAAIKSGRRPE
jgi:hypothetical protein